MANEVVINVTADTSRAKAGLAGIADKMKAVGRAATVAGGIITGIGVASITAFAKMGDEVHKMALRTGFSTEALSGLRVAAELSGTSLKGLETGLRRMSNVIMDAKAGLGESVDALNSLGVSVDDLIGKSPEQQFEILTMALADMSDKTAQVATATDVFGRAGTALLPMLADGAAGFKELTSKAAEMGVEFDQDAANSAARLTDSLGNLKASFQGVMFAIAEQLAPIISGLAEDVGTAISKISEWTDANPGLTKVIVLVTAAVGALLLVLGPLMMVLPGIVAIAPAVGAAFTIMMGPVGLIALAIAALVAGIIGLAVAWNKNLGGIQEKTQAVFGFIKGLYTSKFGWLLPGGALIKALIMLKDNWGAIWGGMKDFVASIWNKILETTSTAINFIITNLNKLIKGFNLVFKTNIPPIEDMVATLQEVGSAVRDNIDDFIQLGLTVPEVMTVAEAEAERFKNRIAEVGEAADETAERLGNIVAPTMGGLTAPGMEGFAGIAKVDDTAFLEYGRRLQKMGRPMEDLTDEADKLSKKFGITMSDAIDHIARVKMRELDQEFNAFMDNLLAKRGEVLGVHRAPTDFRAGAGSLAGDDPLGIKAAFFAGGGKILDPFGMNKPRQGFELPPGLQGQGTLSAGTELIAAHGRGDISATELRAALAGLTIQLDGKQIGINQGSYELFNEEFPLGL
jgi:TP901 family phage tail tape measure protein